MSEQREQFRRRVEELVAQFERDVDPNEWATRRYPKRIRDEDRTVYEVPALYLQKGPVKLLLDPIGYDLVDAEGAFDLYLIPVYDPTVSLFLEKGRWMIYCTPPLDFMGEPSATETQILPLTTETINHVLNSIADHVVPSI